MTSGKGDGDGVVSSIAAEQEGVQSTDTRIQQELDGVGPSFFASFSCLVRR